jgi:hypothetical protein
MEVKSFLFKFTVSFRNASTFHVFFGSQRPVPERSPFPSRSSCCGVSHPQEVCDIYCIVDLAFAYHENIFNSFSFFQERTIKNSIFSKMLSQNMK